MSLATQEEFTRAVQNNADEWVPACGGREVESSGSDGRRYLYCWNPYRAEHRYIRDDDIVIWDNMELPRNLR